MPFCYSPWTNIDISPSGHVAPCCKFQTQHYSEKFNISSHNLESYTNSQMIQKIKSEFLEGQWPAGCERCQIEEQHNIQSKRQLDYIRWENHYRDFDISKEKFITASVAFGNTCNLKCITCGPSSSSKWHQEYAEIYGKNVTPIKFYKKDFVEEFVNQSPNIIHLDVPGGEPFLSGVTEQQQLLQYYVDSGQSKNITLHYTTNATVWPNLDWWNLWQHFQEVDIQLSIDAVNDRYEYIRYPADWNTLVSNVSKYLTQQQICNNIRLSVSHTVSAYNIYYLDEFFRWCQTVGLPTPWLGRVHNPLHMRPTVWPAPIRKKIYEKLCSSQHPDVVIWGNMVNQVDDSKYYSAFIEKLYQHDQYRNLNFKKTFPELAPYI